MTSVLVLGGGPDAEREVSIHSATGVREGCLQAGLKAELLIVDRPTAEEIDSWNADVIFPVLHGRFGEGGQLQQQLMRTARPFVGCLAQPAQFAMDKLATKLLAATLGIPTKPSMLLDSNLLNTPEESLPSIDFPLIIKPVADGSSCGLYLCPNRNAWIDALHSIRSPSNPSTRSANTSPSMIEPMINGPELTVGVIDDGHGQLRTLPIIQISPATGVYDYQAKYERDDTIYTLNPDLADELVSNLNRWALSVCNAIGIRHLARVDFMLDQEGNPWLLEVNTMPGFTATSLLPKAAGAIGMSMPELCKHLVQAAVRTHNPVHQ